MPKDQYDGQGGSYVVDPDTQERKLVERTDWTPPEAAAAETPDPVESEPAATKTRKGA